MADVLFVFPLTQDSLDVPDSFPLVADSFTIIAHADDAVVKSVQLATGVHLVDVAEADPTVMQLAPGLSLVNHGAVSRDTINQVFLALATRAGLVSTGAAGRPASQTDTGVGSVITAALADTELLTGYTAP